MRLFAQTWPVRMLPKATNTNPRLRKIIQLNALGPGLMTLGALGAANEMTASEQP